MKKTLLTTTFLITLVSTAAFAHHPAADMVDPEIYATIDENVSDTPHADMTFDDMGGDMEAASSASEAGSRSDLSAEASEVALEAEEMVDTIDLLDNVASALAE